MASTTTTPGSQKAAPAAVSYTHLDVYKRQEDIMIILGDVGLNYYGDSRDRRNKEKVANLPITLFCIHGNHERRPTTIVEYKLQEWNGGKVWVEEAYPNSLFAKDGEIYDIAGMKTIVIGGRCV